MILVAIAAVVFGFPGLLDYETTASRAWRVWAGYMQDRERDARKFAREARVSGDAKAEAMWLERAIGFARKHDSHLEHMRTSRGNYLRDLISKLDVVGSRRT